MSWTYSPETVRLEVAETYAPEHSDYRLVDERGDEFGRITLSRLKRGKVKGLRGDPDGDIVYIGWVSIKKYTMTPKNWRDVFAAIAVEFPGTSEACGRRVSGWHKDAPKRVCYKLRRRA